MSVCIKNIKGICKKEASEGCEGCLSFIRKRWVGDNGVVDSGNTPDNTGISFNDRYDSDKRNIDDLIQYFENSGEAGLRPESEQERYWASLLRDLLIKQLIRQVEYLVTGSEGKEIKKVNFICGDKDCLDISHITFNEVLKGFDLSVCKHLNDRKDDIEEYFLKKLNRNELGDDKT